MKSKTNSVVAVFDTHDQAEAAIKKLQKDGFDMKQLSIVGKDIHTEEHVVGYYNAGDRMLYWGKQGAYWGGFWGGMWAILFGSAYFLVPGIGPLLVATMPSEDQHDLVRLVAATNSVQAHIWQQGLEEEGIRCQVLGDDLEAGFGELQGFSAEVWVEAADLVRAEEILRQHRNHSKETAPSEDQIAIRN